jgi:putative transposase
MRFALISQEEASFPIAFMCRHLEVSRSGYYAWKVRSPSARAKSDAELVPLIRAEFDEHPRGCGSRTVVGALREAGREVGRRRVVRLMAQERLQPRYKRRFAYTTNSRHGLRTAKNLVARNFTVGTPNKVWAADITYLHTKCGWAYLAVVLDLGTRKVIGWNVSLSLEQEGAIAALEAAIAMRGPGHALTHHSDRGVQYAGDAYRALLARHNIACSMSRKGNCWDNAVVESFFSSLKRELDRDAPFEDWRDAERAVFEYVESYYNTRRRHSALGYISPNKYENLLEAA